jgi:glyoxylase-like metal-dependent hydrolase (beta-lactamase superfamily II)
MFWIFLLFLFGYFNSFNLAHSGFQSNREYLNTTNASIIRINEGKVRIHTFKPNQYIVSSYIIELPSRLVLIDFQTNPLDSANMLRYASSLNKPIDRGYLTHYHFDHWGGVETFKSVPIYALSETIDQIRSFYVNGRDNAFKTKAADFLNYAKSAKLGSELIDGVEFFTEKVIDGENRFTMTIRLPSHNVLAVGDLVFNQKYVYVAEVEDYNKWFSTLKRFFRYYPYRNILIGHGDPGGPKIVKETHDYLLFIKNVANNYKTLAEYRSNVLKRYPNYSNKIIIDCPFTNLNCAYGIF